MGGQVSTLENHSEMSRLNVVESEDEIYLSAEEEVPVNSGQLAILKDLNAERQANLLMLIDLMLDLASVLDEQQRQLDIAHTAFASVGVAGGIVSVVGFGLAFVTFGASLIVSLVGGGVMILSSAGSLASTVAENVVAKAKWKIINEKLEKQHQLETRICEIIKMAAKAAKKGASIGCDIYGIATDGAKLADVAGDVGDVIGGAASAGKAAYRAANAGVPLAKTITTTFGKLAHYGGVVFTVGGMAFDIYTIVNRSIKIHNKKPSKAADEIRKLTYRLKGDHQHKPSYCERRCIDLQLRSTTSVLF